VLKLADRGLDALSEDAGMANGLQVHAGQVTHRGLAEDVKRPYLAFPGKN
jgi:alanine dehydrogenase